MGLETAISWTDYTWNPWQGCTKVSPACANCYMFRDMKRYGKDPAVVRRSAPATFNLPLKKTREGDLAFQPGKRVFTCSWSDWFHQSADPWRSEAWEIVRQRPDLTFQIVTKRTERILDCLPSDWGDGYRNVILIATVENQEWADIRVPQLLDVPAWRRGLSCEPLLGPIDLLQNRPEERMLRWVRPMIEGIHWVITGGESGPGARMTHPYWCWQLQQQCEKHGVAFHHKQNGEWGMYGPDEADTSDWNGDEFLGPKARWFCADGRHSDDQIRPEEYVAPTHIMCHVGVKKSGRKLYGREWSEFPNMEAACSAS